MGDGAITSPPYPYKFVTSASLYNEFAEFRTWFLEQATQMLEVLTEHPEHLAHIGTVATSTKAKMDALARVPDLCSREHWERLSVFGKSSLLLQLQNFRESWDGFLRHHERDFDDQVSVLQQYQLLCIAAQIVRCGMMLPEELELYIERCQHATAPGSASIIVLPKKEMEDFPIEPWRAEESKGEADPE